MQGESRKQFLLKQLKQLENARRPYEDQWRELCDFILPNCGRFPGDPPNQVKRNGKILDPTGGLASRTLESGMLTGITSPTRPWFSLSTLDKNLMSRWTVKVWLKQVQERMNEVLNRSNFYQTVPVLYRYLGTIGTSAILILEDEESVIRTHVLPVGSYYVANSERLKIDTVFRRLSMTCRQMIGRFGLDAVSDNVKSSWNSGNYEQWFEVIHAVMPNVDRDSGKLNAKNKRYRSVYFETTGDDIAKRLNFDYII